MIWTLIALIVPNAILCATENLRPLHAAVNILLPTGFYWWMLTRSRHTGKMVWALFPFIFLAAFELVLLNLYGRSVIAVDMFLNLVTTNATEAGELLGNLLPALGEVALLYLVPLVMATVAVIRRRQITERMMGWMRRAAFVTLAAGGVCLAAALLISPRMRLSRELFPVNAISNAITAVDRYHATRNYAATSSAMKFGAISLRPDSLAETYLMVIGETSRAENWQAAGYDRPTSPWAASDSSAVFFPLALSESNTTHKSVPMLLSHIDASTFADSINCVRSIITAFREAGFETWFISAQRHNQSYIDFYSNEANHQLYIPDTATRPTGDFDLLAPLDEALCSPARKKLIVLHTYGSHFNYADRYDRQAARFTPDSPLEATPSNRKNLINAYDNSIAATDSLLGMIATRLRKAAPFSAMVYTSDHGEDIYDDSRELFLHASPVPSYHQINVPFIVWLSPDYAAAFPQAAESLRRNARLNVSSSEAMFHTTASLAGLRMPQLRTECSTASPDYAEPPRRYLNDLNESVTLEEARLDPVDFESLKAGGYSM